MVFQVPPSKASFKQNRYEFQLPDDDTIYSVPKLKFLKPHLLAGLRGQDATGTLIGILDAYYPGLTAEKFDGLDQTEALYLDWAKESGIDLGESSGSADSSTSTAEPSTEISSSPAEASTISAPAV